MDIGKFLEIEKKYDLYNKEAENVNYWVYERFWLWNYRICAAKLNLMPSQSNAKQNIWGSVGTLSQLLKNCIFRGRMHSTKYDICFVAHERRSKRRDYYECIYTEALSRHFKNSITLEEPFELKHFKPVRNKELFYTDYILVQGELYSRIHIKLKTKLYKKIYTKIMQDMENPIKELISEYGLDIMPEELYGIFVRRVLIEKVCRNKYERLISRINPKIIVEVVHYNAQNMMINEIAGKHGIKTIELQHGTMHDEHLAYQYAVNQKIKQLPQMLFTFSEYWNQVIHIPNNSTKVSAVGFPFFEEKVKKLSRKEMFGIKNILFISQGTIGGYLYKLAVELDNLIDKDEYHIIYKLHPSENSDWKERYGVSGESNIEVIDNLDVNLYELFSKSSIQVGVYSTAVYEGIGFGIRTYIYNIAHADTMERLVQMGAAEYIESAEELLEKLMVENDTGNIKEFLWKTNAFQNICVEISSLLMD